MRTTLLALALTFAAAGAFAQAVECNPDVAPEKCTFDQAYEFYRTIEFSKVNVQAAEKETVSENKAVEVPDAFAGRIHNTYQDFLNLFGFAINKVEESENGQALTVRFNPFRAGRIAAGANVTVSKPVVSEALVNDLPQTGRTDVVTALQKQMGDLDSLSFSASAALQTTYCDFSRPGADRCFGRQPRAYRHLLSVALSRQMAAVMPTGDDTEAKTRLADVATPEALEVGIFHANLASGTTNLDEARAQLRALALRDAGAVVANRTLLDNEKADRVAALIDNQPQAALSATYNAPGRYGGPEGTTYSFEFQWGQDNLNVIRKQCGTRVNCLQDELERRMNNGVNTLKWVVSASYKRNNAWSVPSLGLEKPPEGFDGFTLARNNELSVKAQGGWKMATRMGGENMRIDFSLEGQRLEVGDKVQKNRWVAASTFTVPIGEEMSVPVTLTWANRSQFLPDDSQKVGMHIGITYRIPDMPFRNRN